MIKYYVKIAGQVIAHFFDYEQARDYADWFPTGDTVYVESNQHGVEFIKWN